YRVEKCTPKSEGKEARTGKEKRVKGSQVGPHGFKEGIRSNKRVLFIANASPSAPPVKRAKVKVCTVSTPPPAMFTLINVETMDEVPSAGMATSAASPPVVS
ncbi:hypothetical protein AMTR_s00074p00099890, partial [Amborella trichopoda]